jgi:hypothetical protein
LLTGADASRAIRDRMRAGCDRHGRSQDLQAQLVRAVRYIYAHADRAPVARLRVKR